jgi:hypothetical protein
MPEARWNDDESFEKHIAPSRQALDRLIDISRELQNWWGYLPSADSRAMAERAEGDKLRGSPPWDSAPGSAAQHVLQLIIYGAEDHGKGLVQLLESNQTPVFAQMVLARACLEHAAKAWWMLEPTIDVRLRIARGVNERLFALAEIERLPVADETRRRATERRQALLSEGELLDFNRVGGKRRMPATLLEGRPTQTHLVKQLLRSSDDEHLGRILYGYYSAVAHGNMLGLGLSLTRDAPGLPETPGVTWAAFHTSSTGVVNLIGGVVLGLGAAYKRRNDFFGWESEAWNQAWLGALCAVRDAIPTSQG